MLFALIDWRQTINPVIELNRKVNVFRLPSLFLCVLGALCGEKIFQLIG
jgi:hypothetical protein